MAKERRQQLREEEDKDYQDLARTNLEEAITTPEHVVHSTAISENKIGSEVDADSESFNETHLEHQ